MSAEALLTGVGEVHDEAPLLFSSRRSPVLSQNGIVSSSQPLATAAGLRILQKGGNAADAAVAVAACLNVTEPCSTGIGGDAFCLFYDAAKKTVSCVQGNGRSPAALTLDLIQKQGIKNALPVYSGLTVVVPGAAAAWADIVERFGTLPLSEVLAPAIDLAEKGYPVSPITASHWARGVEQLQQGGPSAGDMLIDGRAPRAGEIMKMPNLGKTFRLLAEHGKKGFYEGPVAEAIVKAIDSKGGVFTLEDLKAHETAFPEPIHTTYKGIQVWEVPPPTHGLAALIALNILEAQGGGPSLGDHSSVQHYHVLIETMRLAFADSLAYIADPLVVHCPIQELLSKEHGKQRAAHIDLEKAIHVTPSIQGGGSDTVYFCVVDSKGNACSMINSNFMGFGTGIIPEGCGFSLQNRGYGFSLDPSHPNCLGPRKRPYHTIIPGLATYAPKDGDESHAGDLFGPFGVMGGFMQPQGHLQVIVNLLDHGMDPQAALDAPRFCISGLPGVRHSAELIANSQCYLEDQPGAEETAAKLREMGHEIKVLSSHDRASFGRGQIIVRDRKTGVLWAGSDPRADGCAMGW